MRLRVLSATIALTLLGFGSSARAQVFGGGQDPFTVYYGFWLPRQAALAATPRPEQTVNAMAALRQESALTERAGLYDPIQPFGVYDPNAPFGSNRGYGKRHSSVGYHQGNSNGNGPGQYYNRTASYFPGLRAGRGLNANAAVGGRPGNRNYNNIGKPSMNMSMPGPGGGMPR